MSLSSPRLPLPELPLFLNLSLREADLERLLDGGLWSDDDDVKSLLLRLLRLLPLLPRRFCDDDDGGVNEGSCIIFLLTLLNDARLLCRFTAWDAGDFGGAFIPLKEFCRVGPTLRFGLCFCSGDMSPKSAGSQFTQEAPPTPPLSDFHT